MLTHFHAIVWIDHSQARIFHIGLSGEDKIVLHPHLPTLHLHHKANSIGSGHAARDEAFFAQVMNVVTDAGKILVIGPSSVKRRNLPNTSANDTQKPAIASLRLKLLIIPATARSLHTPSSILGSDLQGLPQQAAANA